MFVWHVYAGSASASRQCLCVVYVCSASMCSASIQRFFAKEPFAELSGIRLIQNKSIYLDTCLSGVHSSNPTS